MHNKTKDYRGIAPYYQRHPYKSVYDGIQIEIQIVDHCNLNCRGCNHFSPCLDSWFISIDELQNNLIKAKNNIPNIKRVILIGGEPTLHPELDKICDITRLLFPEIEIEIQTNGIDLIPLERIINNLLQNNIYIHFTCYNNTNISKIQNFQTQYKNSTIGTQRMSMGQTIININPEDAKENFYNCKRYNLPCFTLKDYKLYFCPFAAYAPKFMNQQGLTLQENDGIDFLYLDDINNNLDILQDFCFTPKMICSYCHSKIYDIPWIKSKLDPREFFITILDLYYLNYEEYLKIINNKPIIHNNLNTIQNNRNNIKIMNKFGNGKIDIIIPYYNMDNYLIEQLYNTLINQTIINDCAIYLISDNSPNESEVIKKFNNSKLNITFLKTETRSGPGAARNIGIKNSYNQFLFFLDADDYFLHNTSLEELYNEIINKNEDIVFFFANSDIKTTYGVKKSCIVKRNHIEQNQIYFPALYMGEDEIFYTRLKYFGSPQYHKTDKHFIAYGFKDNNTHLNEELHYNEFVFNFVNSIPPLILCSEINNEMFIYKEIVRVLRLYYFCKYNQVFLYYSLYYLYTKYPEIFIKATQDIELLQNFNGSSIQKELNNILNDFQNNQLKIFLEDRILDNENDIKEYLCAFVKTYNTNPLIAPSIAAMINIFKLEI